MSPLRLLPLLVVPVVGGCFFDEPINERPSVEVAGLGVPIYKGDRVTLRATTYDDGDELRHAWMASECSADPEPTCGWPFATAAEESFDLTIPSKRPIRVTLSAFDGFGAHGDAFIDIQAQNRAPSVALQLQGIATASGGYTIGRTLVVAVASSDPDGVAPLDPTGDALEISVDVEGDSTHPVLLPIGASAYSFAPAVIGTYTATVTVDDGDGGTDGDTIGFEVLSDTPPCIGALSAPTGVTLVLDQAAGPRTLAVLTVSDDLDPYPVPSGSPDPLLGETRFRWLAGPAGELVEIDGHNLPDLLVDPAGSWPGEVLEVRVEIADRVPRTLCADDEPSCALSDGCLQRVTWTLEVR